MVTSKPNGNGNSGVKKPDLLKIDRISKLFGDVRAVDDVSLTIEKGEIFSLLGGSAQVNRRFCAFWQGLKNLPAAGFTSMVKTSPTWRPMTGPSI